jgi:hypothetical protein
VIPARGCANVKVVAAFLATALVTGAPLVGQQVDDGLTPGRRHLSGYVAGSWTKQFGPAYSSIPTQPYGMLIGRTEYVLESSKRFALTFYMEVIPAIVVGGVPHYHYADLWVPPAGPTVRGKVWDDPGLVYGFGLTPAGMQAYVRKSDRLSFFLSTSGGAAWFTRDMPVPDARQLNFLVDLGGGIRVANRNGSAFVAGVKFHHMSNANLGRQNPGMDGNLLYAGLSRPR